MEVMGLESGTQCLKTSVRSGSGPWVWFFQHLAGAPKPAGRCCCTSIIRSNLSIIWGILLLFSNEWEGRERYLFN